MTDSDWVHQETAAAVNDWVRLVRRARLGRTVKLVALMIATYANPDGTKAFPGVARLTVHCEVDARTVQRALAALRRKGLIMLARRGARRSGKSDEYQLVIAADLLDLCDVLTREEEQRAIEAVTEQWRHGSTRHPRRVEPPGPADDHTTPVTCESGSTRQRDAFYTTPVSHHPPEPPVPGKATSRGKGRNVAGRADGDVHGSEAKPSNGHLGCAREGCGKPLPTPKSTYCSPACKQDAYRKRKTAADEAKAKAKAAAEAEAMATAGESW